MKYSKDFTRALVFSLNHAKQYSEHVNATKLPNDQGKTSYIRMDRFQNVCAHSIGSSKVGALKEEMWNEIYNDYLFIEEHKP